MQLEQRARNKKSEKREAEQQSKFIIYSVRGWQIA